MLTDLCLRPFFCFSSCILIFLCDLSCTLINLQNLYIEHTMTAQPTDDNVETPEMLDPQQSSLPFNPFGAERLADDAFEEGNVLWLKGEQSCDLPEYAQYDFSWGICNHPVVILLFDSPNVWVCSVSAPLGPRLSRWKIKINSCSWCSFQLIAAISELPALTSQSSLCLLVGSRLSSSRMGSCFANRGTYKSKSIMLSTGISFNHMTGVKI